MDKLMIKRFELVDEFVVKVTIGFENDEHFDETFKISASNLKDFKILAESFYESNYEEV